MKIRNLLLTAAAVTTAAVVMTSGGSADDVMTRSADGTYVVNTTTLAPTVKGYAGATPLKIHIKNDRVVKIEALPNRESHRAVRQMDRQACRRGIETESRRRQRRHLLEQRHKRKRETRSFLLPQAQEITKNHTFFCRTSGLCVTLQTATLYKVCLQRLIITN